MTSDHLSRQVPLDVETGHRLTANPLMLSVAISIFEQQRDRRWEKVFKAAAGDGAGDGGGGGAGGNAAASAAVQRDLVRVEMPETTVALYDQATAVILEREGIAILKRKLANTSGSFKALNGWGRIRGKSVPLDGMVQAVFFEAHAAERRVITTFHLEEAALGLFAPDVLAAIRCDLPHFEGRAAKGHYVEILAGPHIGMRGVVSARPFRVVLSDGRMSDMLREVDFRSSGLDEASGRQFETSQRAKRRAAVSAACANLPAELRETLQAMLRRVAADKLPLFTLLQSEPYQMQSSHLSFQEYYTARSICDGRRLPPNVGAPWRWSSWWRNTLRLGAEMGDRFGRGLLRAISDESDGAVSGGRAVSGEGSSPEFTKPRSELPTRSELELELKGKIGGDLPTSMLAVAQLMRATLAIGLGGNKLGADELLMVAEGLRRSTCLTQVIAGLWWPLMASDAL